MSDLPHPRIDAHVHIWRRGVSDYAWITPELGELYADFPPERAGAALAASGIDAGILVQAEDSLADTQYMLDAADAHDWVAGVVGWVPLENPALAEEALGRWTAHPAFRGVRQLVHIDPRDDLLHRPEVIDTLRLIADRGLAFDVPNAWPRHLAGVSRIAQAVPGLTVVIDHLGKPPISGDDFEAWRAAFRDAAAHPNTVAKFSGLEGAGPEFSAAALRESWNVALDAFGPARIAWGGDWPMTVPHGGYARSWEVMSGLIAELSPTEQHNVLSGTARRTYRLESPWR